MGIGGLLPFVKNSCRPANVKDFKGSTVAIDAYSWLHKGAFSCAEKLVKGEKTDGYVYYCMKRLEMLLQAGLRPIMVFDGCNLSSKEVTEKKRRENREKTRQRGKELLCEGKVTEARECFQRCVDVTPDMAREVVEACRKKSIDCIVAPYEADAQLAYLDKIGMAQLIITEDSDLILFGCSRILFKMDACGGGSLYEKENLSKSFGNKALKFSFEKFRYMCILSGCDYLPSLHGIGLSKACKFFTLTNNTDLNVVLLKLPSYLKMPKLIVPKTYIESFIKADNTFLYQLVFCPQKKCLVPLNPYPDDVDSKDMEYAGKYLPDDLAHQLAMGNINVKTMKKFDVSWSDPPEINVDKSLVWGSQKAAPKAQVNAFKFSTPKAKVAASVKRPFTSMSAKCESEAPCTDEELFSMYSTPKRSHLEEDYLDEDPMGESCNLPKKDLKENSSKEAHPKNLNIPFRKIVRSRFFSSENTPNTSLNTSHSSLGSPDIKKNSSSLSVDLEQLESTENSPGSNRDMSINESKPESNSDFDPAKDSQASASCSVEENKCEFTIDLLDSEKFKDVIVHRFAKKKVTPKESILSQSDQTSPDKPTNDTTKQDSWLDLINEEHDSTTSTVSSTGKATKLLDTSKVESPRPAFLNNPLKSTTTSKKLTLRKLQDFKWTREPKLRQSLSLDNSCSDYLDASQETNASNASSQVSASSSSSQVSSYFSSAGASCDSAIDLVSDSDEDAVQTKRDEDASFLSGNLSKTLLGGPKTAKCLSNKSGKSGKCRTLGLSKNRKSSEKVSKKETLLNFNFFRHSKKEAPSLS